MLTASSKYEILYGTFNCQDCSAAVQSCRYYPESLEITWKCRECDCVSYVSIEKARGY